jgi:hypothetical protein
MIKKIITKSKPGDPALESGDLKYWLGRPPVERLEAASVFKEAAPWKFS